MALHQAARDAVAEAKFGSRDFDELAEKNDFTRPDNEEDFGVASLKRISFFDLSARYQAVCAGAQRKISTTQL